MVVQLLGGNDGLNTVVPHGIDGYNRGRQAAAALERPDPQDHPRDRPAPVDGCDGQARREQAAGGRAGRRLSQPRPLALPLDGDLGIGRLENDAKALETGWLGRALDSPPATASRARPARPAHRQPLAAAGASLEEDGGSRRSRASRATSFSSPAPTPRSKPSAAPSTSSPRSSGASDDPLLGFISRTTLSAYESSSRLEQLAKKGQGGPKYPNFGLAKRLELIAQIIKADFGTRIFYTSLDGFDTHANQLGTHAALLLELSDSIAAFHDDLTAAGQGDRVALLTFSEFGRRVLENASRRHRPRRRRAALPRRPGREGRTRRCASRASTISTTAT